MNLSAIDLNLLAVLDALLREQHVGRAARAVGRSQPAVSHALNRLRALFADRLLVQVGRRMIPTPRAAELRGPLALALRDVRGLFEPTTFVPARSRRSFRLMMPDVVSDALVPRLMARLGQEAPGIRIEVAPWHGPDTLTNTYLGGLDFVISMWAGRFPGLRRDTLYVDTDMLAVRRGHAAARSLSRLDTFLAARHVAVVGPGEREDAIDTWLGSLGYERRVALSVPSYLLALRIAAATDLVAFVPHRLIAGVGTALDVAAVAPPIDAGTDELYLHYPSRMEDDAGSGWMRTLLGEIAAALAPTLSGRGRHERPTTRAQRNRPRRRLAVSRTDS